MVGPQMYRHELRPDARFQCRDDAGQLLRGSTTAKDRSTRPNLSMDELFFRAGTEK